MRFWEEAATLLRLCGAGLASDQWGYGSSLKHAYCKIYIKVS